MDFLFHKVTDKEKKEIQKQAKDILDNFSKKLSGVDKKIEESLIEREDFERDGNSEAGNCEKSFSRKIMFENAPEKNNDFIIAEKKKW